ncbi:MAG: PEP-CTERM sorting domain-containing protein, partial [Sedimentisphaerales bacterium]|nr:PEP-CTERM sorting domain-containing protein [Sedimentisphaerales bacterium]
MAGALILAGASLAQATSLHNGPLFLETLNYEVGTSYSGGEAGKFYLLSETTTYDTLEYGTVDKAYLESVGKYGGIISGGTLTVTRDDTVLKSGEDAFGLLRVNTIHDGTIGGLDSPYGDGDNTTLIGNNISAAGIYWAENVTDGDYLRGILYGGQDQIVQCVTPGDIGDPLDPFDDIAPQYRIWQAGAQFDIWLIDASNVTYIDPSVAGNPTPWDRPAAEDEFPGWFDPTRDALVMSGDIDYFRFWGNAADQTKFVGQTDVLLDFSGNKEGLWDKQFINWYQLPVSDENTQDMWQSWEIGRPFIYENGWTGSEDSGKAYIVPEPVTMLGMFLAVGSLGGYIRKRRMA